MCFSASISFLTTALLIATASRLRTKLAIIPGLFAVQQAAEGAIWLDMSATLSWYAGLIFLVIALCCWPLVIPLTLGSLETDQTKKKLIMGCRSMGLVWSVVALYVLATSPVSVASSCGHIAYHIKLGTFYAPLALIWYGSATILPFFLTSQRFFTLFGIALLGSCLATYGIWYFFFTSVWCFFAAVLSSGLLFYERSK